MHFFVFASNDRKLKTDAVSHSAALMFIRRKIVLKFSAGLSVSVLMSSGYSVVNGVKTFVSERIKLRMKITESLFPLLLKASVGFIISPL